MKRIKSARIRKNAVNTVSEAMKELEDSVGKNIQFDSGRNTIH
ncbi:hypothetical protein RCO48_24310 [Peribacillus frigoritolerans]|nr:hypothetical protein [Peribacillus frigoritolerans]